MPQHTGRALQSNCLRASRYCSSLVANLRIAFFRITCVGFFMAFAGGSPSTTWSQTNAPTTSAPNEFSQLELILIRMGHKSDLPQRIGYGILLAAIVALPIVAWNLFSARPSGFLRHRGPLLALLGLVAFLMGLLVFPLFGMRIETPELKTTIVEGGLTIACALLVIFVSGGSAVTARDRGGTIGDAIWVAIQPFGILVAMRADDPDE